MADSPRVTVLMTVYNAAPWLSDAVDSVVAQTYADWELVALDDGSTDESAAILASYADPRIRMISMGRNIGRTAVLRRAFDVARGELIAPLDADDVAHPRRLEAEVAFLDTHADICLVGAWATLVDADRRPFARFTPPVDRDELRDSFGWLNPIVHSSSMYRAAAARAVGGYPESLPYAQDGGLWVRLAEVGGVGMVGELLCEQRVLPGSMTRDARRRADVARDTLTLLEYARDHLQLRSEARRRNREELAVASFRLASALARSGRRLAAARVAAATLVGDPRSAVGNRVVRSALRAGRSQGGAPSDYLQYLSLR